MLIQHIPSNSMLEISYSKQQVVSITKYYKGTLNSNKTNWKDQEQKYENVKQGNTQYKNKKTNINKNKQKKQRTDKINS